MQFFKQISVFLLLLIGLLFAKNNLNSVFAYGGIDIPGENNIPLHDVLISNDNSWEDGVNYINNSLYYLIDVIKNVLYFIALVYIIIAGLKIVTAGGEEDVIKSNKDTIVYALFGFVVILIADTAVKNVFYGGAWPSGSTISPGECLLNPNTCTENGRNEILGVVHWGKSLLAIIAVIEIVVSGIRLIMAVGEEDVVEKEKKVYVWVGLGLLIMVIDEVIIGFLYKWVGIDTTKENGLAFAPEVTSGVNQFVGVIQFIIQFIGVFAVMSLIYAGFLMIFDFGDSEKVDKAKLIIKDAIIGLILVSLSYVLVSTVAIG